MVGSVQLQVLPVKRPNYAFKPIAEQALRPNQTIVPQRLNAALAVRAEAAASCHSDPLPQIQPWNGHWIIAESALFHLSFQSRHASRVYVMAIGLDIIGDYAFCDHCTDHNFASIRKVAG